MDKATRGLLDELRRLDACLPVISSNAQYLRADQRACVAAIENLWGKYAVTARQIEAERDAAAKEAAELRKQGHVLLQ